MRERPEILCVEDDATALKVVEQFLLRHGYTVLAASSGEEALEVLEEARPDLILLDVMMPGMSGYEVCERLQRDEELAYIPVIFLTALSGEEDRAGALAAGAVDFLVKPVQRARLLQKVSAHLETSEDWAKLRGSPETPTKTFGDYGSFVDQLAERLDLAAPDRDFLAGKPPGELYDATGALGISSEQVAVHAATFLGVPYLPELDPQDVALGVLPTQLCVRRGLVPLDDGLAPGRFAVENPLDPDAMELLRRTASDEPRIHVTTPGNVAELLAGCSDPGRRKTTMPVEETPDRIEHLLAWAIEVAHQMDASEIHFEPWEEEVAVGVRLKDAYEIVRRVRPRGLIRPLVKHVKELASLEGAAARHRQTGTFVWQPKRRGRVALGLRAD